MRRVFSWVTCLLLAGCAELADFEIEGEPDAGAGEWVLLGAGEVDRAMEAVAPDAVQHEAALTTTGRVSRTGYFHLTSFAADLRGLLGRTRAVCPAKVLRKGSVEYLFFWNTKYRVNVGWNAATRLAKVLDPVGMSFETTRATDFAGVGGEVRIEGPRYMSPAARASMVRDMKATLGGLSNACR